MRGGLATPRAFSVLAPNPGPMTLDGTNTWWLQEPGSDTVAVVDPGPDQRDHWQAVAREVERRGARIDTILLTHRHGDHSAGADLFARETGCGVRAWDPELATDSEPLVDGEIVVAGGCEVTVVASPGHSSDSVCFWVSADRALLTGDTILGRGTTVVAFPDGNLEQYLATLDQLQQMAADGRVGTILSGHGPLVTDPLAVVGFYLDHRAERLEQVRVAAADLTSQGSTELAEEDLAALIVEQVYADVPRVVWPAALLSVRSQLEYLRR